MRSFGNDRANWLGDIGGRALLGPGSWLSLGDVAGPVTCGEDCPSRSQRCERARGPELLPHESTEGHGHLDRLIAKGRHDTVTVGDVDLVAVHLGDVREGLGEQQHEEATDGD